MQHIGDIMQEMRLTTPPAPSSSLLSVLQSRLREYSCGQLNEEDYAETDDPWNEWPYSWVCQLHGIARERLHSLHQNRISLSGEQAVAGIEEEYSANEYSRISARAA